MDPMSKTQKFVLMLAHPAFHGGMLVATLVATVLAIISGLH